MGRGHPVDCYSLLIASNTGYEVLSFIFFLLAALLLFTLAVRKRMWGWTTMQAFYIATGAYGIFAWACKDISPTKPIKKQAPADQCLFEYQNLEKID